MSIEFGILPRYFDLRCIQEEDRHSTLDSIDETIKQLIDGGMELAPKAYITTKYSLRITMLSSQIFGLYHKQLQ